MATIESIRVFHLSVVGNCSAILLTWLMATRILVISIIRVALAACAGLAAFDVLGAKAAPAPLVLQFVEAVLRVGRSRYNCAIASSR